MGTHREKTRPGRARTRRRVKTDSASFPRRLLTLVLFAVGIALIVEGFNQSSVPRMLKYLAQRPLCFGVNCLIVLASLSLTELFKHRKAMTWTLTALWIILGFANYMVCRNRTLPLAGGDLLLTYEVVSLITVYFSWPEIIAMFLGAAALIALIAWMFSCTARRRRVNYAFGAGFVAVMVLVVFGVHMFAIKAGVMPDVFPDRVNSNREYGFTSCFVFTFGQQGIDKPEEYSTEAVEEIMGESEQAEPETAQPTAVPAAARFSDEAVKQPNIVFVQLESFFDVNTINGVELSRDPTPFFHKLLGERPTGELYVPTVGGGTANVEFEVMSGLNMDFFGAGETPYNTIIQEVSCETIADVLRGHGYSSTALHNNTGTFFSRNQVYANLGFDRFDSLEYMRAPKYNRVGWAHDTVLTGEILRAMETSSARDLIFAITVESHGKYSDTYEPREGDIEVLSAPEEMYFAPFQNYVNVLPAVDTFIEQLVEALEDFDEPVVAVFYGDHLPGVGLDPEMLATGDYYASRYVIWNNYGAEFDAPDLQAYRLSAELLRQMGISDGVMTKFHQAYPVDECGEEYLEKLQILEYDLLYGDQNAYGEAGAPEVTALQMGIEPVELESAVLEYGRLLVTGENFTEFSAVVAGEEALETVFVDAQHIAVALDAAATEALPETICVAQLSPDGKELSRTDESPVERWRAHQ